MQFAGLDGAYLPFVTGVAGAGAAWAMGEDPLMGLMLGFGVGALNHKGERVIGDEGQVLVLSCDDIIIDGWWNFNRRPRPMQSGALTNVYPEFSLIMLWRGLFNLIPKSAVAAKGSTTAFRSFTSSNFRTNLGRLMGNVPANSKAHHIFPQKYQSFFNRAGVNIHDPKFGAWWEKSGHLKNAAGYNAKWAEFIRLNPNATQSQILNQGRTIMQQYGIPVFF